MLNVKLISLFYSLTLSTLGPTSTIFSIGHVFGRGEKKKKEINALFVLQMLKWEKTDISNVAGEIALLAGLVLWATTFPRIRRKMFELFFYTHHLYIVFVLFFVLHVGISYSCIMLPGFYLFMIDRYLRFLQSRQSIRLVSTRILPCQTLELNFSKSKGIYIYIDKDTIITKKTPWT